nr:5-formyltetrahydrofolate cyclo-ligase [Marinobacter caseinilyticus]
MTHTTMPMLANADTLSRTQLRNELRQRRQALTLSQQTLAAKRLARRLLGDPTLFRARHIGVYLPNDGEIDPSLFVAQARLRGIQFYLPVLHPIHKGRLVFSPFDPDTPLRENRFGIPEPEFDDGLRRPAWALDAVLMPLVGFDSEGGRLGMGGGFYDRTFAFSRRVCDLAPKLIGLAHHSQQVDKLPIASWDIPLHAIVSDQGKYRIGH